MAKLKRWTKNRAKDLVARARIASGNNKWGLKDFPKNHWMRKDRAKMVRFYRVDKAGNLKRPGVQHLHY